MSKAQSTPNANEDRGDENASSGTICRVAELDRVRHGVVVETELAIKRAVEGSSTPRASNDSKQRH